jgi:hypothetical protein
MSHFFNCTEEKIMHELDKIQLMLSEELKETGAPDEDLVILTYLQYAKEKLDARINRKLDRCGEDECLRKSTHFDSNGLAKCKYH